MCTTVSTSCPVITLAITGLRMSARTNATLPRSSRGGTTSTPMTRSTAGSAAIRRANRPPKSRETPVTRTTRPMTCGPGPGAAGLLALATTLDARLLQQLAVLLLGHPLATLLDYRTHYDGPSGTSRRPGADVLAGGAPGASWGAPADTGGAGFPRARREVPSLTAACCGGETAAVPERHAVRWVKIRRISGSPSSPPRRRHRDSSCSSSTCRRDSNSCRTPSRLEGWRPKRREALGGALAMNLDRVLRPARKILTTTLVTLVTAAGVTAAAPSTATAAAPAASASRHAEPCSPPTPTPTTSRACSTG